VLERVAEIFDELGDAADAESARREAKLRRPSAP
jgi:hypothetical protein